MSISYPQTSFNQTSFSSTSLLGRRRETVSHTTLLYQLKVLKETGRYDAFKLKWNPIYADKPEVWPVPNHLFWDSDVAKWIEGACYFLQGQENEEVRRAVDELVDMIGMAQQEDGYLNIHFVVVEPDKRWSDLRDLHELYNAGHLIEAALSHNQTFQNDALLKPILKYVELLCRVFGPGPTQKHGYPGHPEIELALLQLYGRVQNPKILALAEYFLTERGNPTGADGRHYYDVEAEARGEREYETPPYFPKPKSYWYQQAHLPLLEQPTVEGHAVRAMYLLTALANLVIVKDLPSKSAEVQTLQRLWNNMTTRKMYLTGGIGAVKQWEGFGIDYFLPQGTDEGGCYAETCAAIGVVMLAERLLQINLNGKYGDIMELCLYNAVLTGMSLDGKSFTYVNQLASSNTDLSERKEWFTCACCPPNMTRLLGYIGGCFWTPKVDNARKAVAINVHLYNSASIRVPVGNSIVEIEQKSDWPWDGKIDWAVTALPSIDVTLRLRIPGWASGWKLLPALAGAKVHNGYLTLPPTYLKQNPVFTLTIGLQARLITPAPEANQDIVAVARGPMIYCLEDFDNSWVTDHFKSLRFDTTAGLREEKIIDEKTNETYIGISARNAGSLYDVGEQCKSIDMPGQPLSTVQSLQRGQVDVLRFIPYYFRANRGGRGQMRVGLRIARSEKAPVNGVNGVNGIKHEL